MTMPTVYFVVITWNGKSDTLDCLSSLSKLEYNPVEVIVVDNGSTDGSVLAIRENFPKAILVETGQNLGYTGGNNVGMRHALDRGADYVCLLNNDTAVDPRLVTELITFAESEPSAGIIGPRQYYFDHPNVVVGSGSRIDWMQGTIRHLYKGMVDTTEVSADKIPCVVDFHDGVCVAVRREYLEKIGLLDERYYLCGFEDADWGIRAVRNGYKVWNVPTAKMWHKISATVGVGSPITTYYMTRNALLFFWENTPIHLRWLPFFNILLRTTRTVGAWTMKPKYQTELFRRKRRANLFAIRDFFLGRYKGMGPDVARVCYG